MKTKLIEVKKKIREQLNATRIFSGKNLVLKQGDVNPYLSRYCRFI